MRVLGALVLMAAALFATPAPIGFVQAAAAQEQRSSFPVAGTRWQGQVRWSDGEYTEWGVLFRPDGVLEYSYNGATYDNGRWTQNNSLIYWHTNNNFALYSGTVAGDTMGGQTQNQRNQVGIWIFKRAP
ncbi:MAG: hypothetical protein J0L81_14635 [Caulobacterales bacterium]|jgi:hypothetical protein|nr:hypothetical protein [Caulobacterales bacterium]